MSKSDHDVLRMTIGELCELAGQLRDGEPGSPAYRGACHRMAIVSWYLEYSGVAYLMGLEEVAPPGFEPEPDPEPPVAERTATILTMPKRRRPGRPRETGRLPKERG